MFSAFSQLVIISGFALFAASREIQADHVKTEIREEPVKDEQFLPDCLILIDLRL